MKNDTLGQVESVFAQAEKKKLLVRSRFRMNVLHEGKACDCWFLKKKIACSRILAE